MSSGVRSRSKIGSKTESATLLECGLKPANFRFVLELTFAGQAGGCMNLSYSTKTCIGGLKSTCKKPVLTGFDLRMYGLSRFRQPNI